MQARWNDTSQICPLTHSGMQRRKGLASNCYAPVRGCATRNAAISASQRKPPRHPLSVPNRHLPPPLASTPHLNIVLEAGTAGSSPPQPPAQLPPDPSDLSAASLPPAPGATAVENSSGS